MPLLRFVLAAGLLLLCAAAPAFAQEPAVLSWEAFWSLVEESERQLAAEDAPLDPLAARWDALDSIVLEDGRQLDVNGGYFAARLREEPVEREQLRGLFATLLASQAQFSQTVEPAPEALQHLQEILARPEYQWPEEQPSLWERLLAPVLERLARLLLRLNIGSGEGGDLFGFLLGLASIIGLAAVVVYVLRQLRSGVVSEAGRHIGQVPDEQLTADEALAQAQNLSRGGDYRSAVRYLYLSSLLLLDERGLLRYDRSKTNREYLVSVRERPELAATLREVIEVFDRVWYGFQPLDAAAYARYQAQVERLRRTGQKAPAGRANRGGRVENGR